MITIKQEEYFSLKAMLSEKYTLSHHKELNTGVEDLYITSDGCEIKVLSKYKNYLGKTYYYKSEIYFKEEGNNCGT